MTFKIIIIIIMNLAGIKKHLHGKCILLSF